ncbi:hypothetical protein EBI_27369, partial [Enterocytozoon bieneusi H348]
LDFLKNTLGGPKQISLKNIHVLANHLLIPHICEGLYTYFECWIGENIRYGGHTGY